MSGGASTNPGLYPGNPALPREVREKILSTFKHTLALYQEGKVDDCLIGCDFILKMDPRFSPARRLIEKAKNPAADVDVIALEAIVAGTPARGARPSIADSEKLLVRAVESYNARDFDACINAAEQVLTATPGNIHATELLDKARRLKQTQADFESARTRGLQFLEQKRFADAAAELDRMRALDPDHPAVSLLERRLPTGTARPGAAPEPALGGEMDLGPPGGGFGAASEPRISFEGAPAAAAAGRGLDALSLDGLSLDGVVTQVAPPADFAATRQAPLELSVPSASPGSPGDLWTDSPEAEASPAAAPPRASAASSQQDEAGSEQEITLLLKQGQDAANRGDYDGAIEIWSRIFLIDINNVEAVTRIEQARQDMAASDQKVPEMIRRGRDEFDAGDLDAARTTFLEALTADPNEPTAREYLDRIEKEMASMLTPAAGPEPGPEASSESEDLGPVEASEPPKAIRPPGRRVHPGVPAIAAVFLVLVAAGTWFVLRQPKTAAPPPPPPRAAGSLEKATAFFHEGRIPETIAELKRIRPTDPDYEKAKALLDTLSRPEAPAAPAGGVAPGGGPATAEIPDAAGIRARAERALAEKRYIDALKDFSTVAPAFQGDPGFAQAISSAQERVSELTPAVKLYNEGEYETAIPVLWRVFQADKGNQDAKSYLLRSYTNQGITQLQNGLFQKAIASFDEALAIDSQDIEVIRHRKFAERYQKGDLDLMGRIYVRHLSHRP